MSQLLEQVLQITLYVQPVQFFLIISTNMINICVLRRRALHVSPCTHYFLAYAVFSIIYGCLVCPIQFLRGFHNDWANGKVGCKIISYLLFFIPVQANLMLTFASFDRYFSSSPSHQLRTVSTIRMARMSIVVGILLSAIYNSPMLIIHDWKEVSGRCQQQSNTVSSIYVLSQMVLFYIVSPALVILLGLLTVAHIRHQSTRAIPLSASRRNRRTEGQLTRMLLLQVTMHLIFGLPFGIAYWMSAFVPSISVADKLGVRYATVMWLQCDYYASFFLYILSGRIYRQQLIQMCKKMSLKLSFNNDLILN